MLTWIERLWKDGSYSLRALWKSPAFAVVATVVLALGLASNLAVFLVVDILFLRPLPVGNPEELVRIAFINKQGLLTGIPSTAIDSLRNETVFQGVCGFYMPELTADVAGAVQNAGILSMSGNCFDTLRVATAIGRPFTASDDRFGAERVAVLTDSFWRTKLGGRVDVIGKTIRVEDAVFTIIGITEQRFTGLLAGFEPELILPLEQTPLHFAPVSRHPPYVWVNLIARRNPRVSEQDVQSRMSVITKQLLEQSVPTHYNAAQRRDYFSRKIMTQSAKTGIDGTLKDRFGKPLNVILGICALVLFISGLNTTNLMLARGLRRQKEIAVRMAVGASKMRIVRLLVFESLLVVSGSSILGVILGVWTSSLLLVQAGAVFANVRLSSSALNFRTLCFLAGLVFLEALIFAVPSVWQAVRSTNNLKEHGRGILSLAGRGQAVVIGLQVALTLALVAGGSLFTSSLRRLDDLNLGIVTRGVSFAMLSGLPGGNSDFASRPYYEALLDRVQKMPDVSSVGLSDFAPFWTRASQESISLVEGGALGEFRVQPLWVTDRFLETLGVSILAGEGFRRILDESGEPTAIVSASLAGLLDDQKLVGKHIRIGTQSQYQRVKVVGIASNLQLSLEDPHETTPLVTYINLWQHPERQRSPVLLVKTTSGIPLAPAVLRKVVESMHHEYVNEYGTVEGQRREALIEERMLAYLSSAFGLLSLILSAVGLFGLLSYHVSGRTSEIGIRIALGASRLQIRVLVIRELLPIMMIGIFGGLALTIISGSAIRGLLYGVSIYDFRFLSASVLTLVVTACLAAWIPTQRACSISPILALRME